MEKNKKYDIKLEGFVNETDLGFEGEYKGNSFLVKMGKTVFKTVVGIAKEAWSGIKEELDDDDKEDKKEDK